MLSARLTAIVTLLVAALAPAAVSGIQCWQCAAVDGRKCPDNSNMVDSPQVSFISRFVDKYGDRLKAATVFRSYIQAETCRKLTQPRKHISPDPVMLLPGARIIAICCKILSDVRTTHIIPFYGNEQCRTFFQHDACITWKLGNGSVILQNVVVFENECTAPKIEFWTRFIDLYYQGTLT